MTINAENIVTSAIAAAVAAVLSGIGWLVRRVFTNQKQLEILKLEMRHREANRAEDRQMMRDTRDDVHRLSGRFDDYIAKK